MVLNGPTPYYILYNIKKVSFEYLLEQYKLCYIRGKLALLRAESEYKIDPENVLIEKF